jgi:6-hydroxycyclohex-1-ene-1-carbonyl-CoA dehydrogenase
MRIDAKTVDCWQLTEPGQPLARAQRALPEDATGGDQVLIEVAGCGVCHTDLGFVYDGVRTRHSLPLTLGHEISGRVVGAGEAMKELLGKAVVVPAVLPCGSCDVCLAGRGAICAAQIFPGNDDHGGFASHVLVPGRGLCVVDEDQLAASALTLADLAVVADAVTTPYQAMLNADLGAGDVAIVIGAGGVGSFGVQIARALGATVIAFDIDHDKLARIAEHGASLTLDASGEPRALKKEVAGWLKQQGCPSRGWKIFEMSGTAPGQLLAYALLTHGGHLGVVGYTRDKVSLRLSNLMAFDATARGTWGCLPEHYPAVVEMVLDGRIALAPFVERHGMATINEIFSRLHAHQIHKRPVLIPDFGADS